MPLKSGSGKAVVSSNIEECLSSYKQTGKVGNTTPKDLAHARKICAAAAYSKARESAHGKAMQKHLKG